MVKKITEFYGDTCPFCKDIEPAVDKLAREDGVIVERLEVWSDARNKQRMEALRHLYAQNCGGNMIVPSFFDPDTSRIICNPASYEALRQWVFDE